MENMILCNGKYAKTPYFLEEENIHLYSIEEVCYYLYKNAFLLQEDFFSDELLAWIKEELDLPEWADTIKKLLEQEKGMLRSIEFLFQITGYYSQREYEKVQNVRQKSNHLTVIERKKIRGDSYCKKQRYEKAILEYEEILEETEECQVKFRAKLYHNIGVCQARLFCYEQAAKAFLDAFHIYPNTESYVQYLLALKLGLNQEQYLDFLAGHPESYEDSLEVENRLKKIDDEWDKMLFHENLQHLMEEQSESYYSAMEQLLKQAKEDYSRMVSKR